MWPQRLSGKYLWLIQYLKVRRWFPSFIWCLSSWSLQCNFLDSQNQEPARTKPPLFMKAQHFSIFWCRTLGFIRKLFWLMLASLKVAVQNTGTKHSSHWTHQSCLRLRSSTTLTNTSHYVTNQIHLRKHNKYRPLFFLHLLFQ